MMKKGFVVALALVGCTSTVANPGTTDQVATSTSRVERVDTTTTVQTSSSTTTTTSFVPEIAWTEGEAEAMVEGYLAALAAGAWDVAAFSAHNNGIVIAGSDADELPSETLERLCADGACNGPYELKALGPGLVNPDTAQASSIVDVTHVESGLSGVIEVATFEGQRIIADLPPLVSSAAPAPLPMALFGDAIPGRVVVERFNGFEVWDGGDTSWHVNWWADQVVAVEDDWALVSDPRTGRQHLVRLDQPERTVEVECAELWRRDESVAALERCSNEWRLVEAESGEEVELGFEIPPVDHESGFSWVEERGGVRFFADGDAEGNLASIVTDAGTEILGNRYAGFTRIASDGSFLALVDHRDPAAFSHFYSPVVVVIDFETGSEVGRWELAGPVLCLEASSRWVLACEGNLEMPEPDQVALVAIDLATGETTRVETRSRLFLGG